MYFSTVDNSVYFSIMSDSVLSPDALTPELHPLANTVVYSSNPLCQAISQEYTALGLSYRSQIDFVNNSRKDLYNTVVTNLV